MRHWNFIKRIRDLDRFSDTSETALVQDSQEIQSVSESIGVDLSDYGCLFVLIGEGEYAGVWGCENYVPYLDRPIDRILFRG